MNKVLTKEESYDSLITCVHCGNKTVHPTGKFLLSDCYTTVTIIAKCNTCGLTFNWFYDIVEAEPEGD